MTKTKRFFYVIYDGLNRFVELSFGIWTDAMLKAYSVIYLGEKYQKHRVSPKIQHEWDVTTHAHNNKSFHQTILQYSATGRLVVWIPIPFGGILFKFFEALNNNTIFIFNKNIKISLEIPWCLRIPIYICFVAQIPLLLAFIYSGNVLCAYFYIGTLIPLFFLLYAVEIVQAWNETQSSIRAKDLNHEDFMFVEGKSHQNLFPSEDTQGYRFSHANLLVSRKDPKKESHDATKINSENQNPDYDIIDVNELNKREPEKHRSVEPDKHRSVEPDKHRSVEPDKHRSVEPDKHRSVEPDKHRSVEPDKRRSVQPDKHRSVEPDKHKSVEREKSKESSEED